MGKRETPGKVAPIQSPQRSFLYGGGACASTMPLLTNGGGPFAPDDSTCPPITSEEENREEREDAVSLMSRWGRLDGAVLLVHGHTSELTN